jgi:hypothetical protein
MMITRSIPLPESGFYCQGPKPECLSVNEVPPAVSDEDLAALIAKLCQGQGLLGGLGEGPTSRPTYNKNYRTLLRLAADRGLPVPVSMAGDAAKMRPAGSLKPAGAGIIDL